MSHDLIEKQLKFVEWLKDRDIYNHMQSSHTMQCMFNVWRIMKEEKFITAVMPNRP